MTKYKYIRISTSSQNLSRQEEKGVVLVKDVCSGTIPFKERDGGKELLSKIKEGDELIVQSTCRLGRDKMDMLLVLEELKKRQVNIFIQNLGLNSFADGKFNPIFDIVTTLLSSLSSYEKEQIKERTTQGIAIAKLQGKYKGRKKGAVLSREQFFERNKEIIKAVKKHPSLSLRELAQMTNVSHSKIRKIREML